MQQNHPYADHGRRRRARRPAGRRDRRRPRGRDLDPDGRDDGALPAADDGADLRPIRTCRQRRADFIENMSAGGITVFRVVLRLFFGVIVGGLFAHARRPARRRAVQEEGSAPARDRRGSASGVRAQRFRAARRPQAASRPRSKVFPATDRKYPSAKVCSCRMPVRRHGLAAASACASSTYAHFIHEPLVRVVCLSAASALVWAGPAGPRRARLPGSRRQDQPRASDASRHCRDEARRGVASLGARQRAAADRLVRPRGVRFGTRCSCSFEARRSASRSTPRRQGTFAGELKDVTLRQAIESVLTPNGLSYDLDGAVIRVFPRRTETQNLRPQHPQRRARLAAHHHGRGRERAHVARSVRGRARRADLGHRHAAVRRRPRARGSPGRAWRR